MIKPLSCSSRVNVIILNLTLKKLIENGLFDKPPKLKRIKIIHEKKQWEQTLPNILERREHRGRSRRYNWCKFIILHCSKIHANIIYIPCRYCFFFLFANTFFFANVSIQHIALFSEICVKVNYSYKLGPSWMRIWSQLETNVCCILTSSV